MDFRPSRELGYVIGAFLGDGSFVEDSDYHHHVKLAVRDKEFAKAFNEQVSFILGRKTNKIIITRDLGKVFYESKYSSKELGHFLERPLQELRFVIDAYPGEFLRGLFSADGCGLVSAWAGLRMSIVLSNSNLSLLELTQSILLSHFQVNSRIYLARKKGTTWKNGGKTVVLRKDHYILRIQRVRDVRTFTSKIGFQIRRKQERMERAIELVDRLGPTKAGAMWKTQYVIRVSPHVKFS